MTQKINYLYESRLEDYQNNCSQELLQFWGNLDNEKQAAFLDSFGKVGARIFTGNVVYLGYYDQCIDIGNTDYCLFPFNVTLTATQTVSSNASVTIPVEIGMCFPSSCDAKNFYDLLLIGSDEAFYSKSMTDINVITYTVNVTATIEYTEPLCPWRNLKWTNSSIMVLTVCVLLIILVIIGTTVDLSLWLIDNILPKLNLSETEQQNTMKYSTTCEVKHSINEEEPLANSKSKTIQTSTDKRGIKFLKDIILAIMATHQPASAVTSINGIRVISMFWIILGHTFAAEIGYSSNISASFANIQEVSETVQNRFLFQLVDSFNFSVDSLFVLVVSWCHI